MKLKVCLILIWLVGAGNVSRAAQFFQFGDLPGRGRLDINDLSSDGKVVVGRTNPDHVISQEDIKAFRWSIHDGLFFAEVARAVAFGVNADGSMIAGGGSFEDANDAFLWSPSTGILRLGTAPHGPTLAYGISDDGSVIAGIAGSGGSDDTEAVRWTEQEGWTGLGDLPGGAFHSRAFGVSADGSAVVGFATTVRGSEAFLWTETDGMQGLGHLPGGGAPWFANQISEAVATSSDGSVVVGNSNSAAGLQAFRWTRATGMVGLTDSDPTVFQSRAADVTADGSNVIGNLQRGTELEPTGGGFVWDEKHGMRDLKDVLANYGLDLTGWSLVARAISADGRVFAGGGRNPEGEYVSWIVVVPEPSCPLDDGSRNCLHAHVGLASKLLGIGHSLTRYFRRGWALEAPARMGCRCLLDDFTNACSGDVHVTRDQFRAKINLTLYSLQIYSLEPVE